MALQWEATKVSPKAKWAANSLIVVSLTAAAHQTFVRGRHNRIYKNSPTDSWKGNPKLERLYLAVDGCIDFLSRLKLLNVNQRCPDCNRGIHK